MAEIVRNGMVSGSPYRFKIAGDTPTADEELRIDSILRQQESAFLDQSAHYGLNPYEGEGSGISNQVGEAFKGIGSGAVNMLESAGLGIAAMLPEDSELKARDAIRRGAIAARRPFAPDLGLENSVAGQIGQGVGSFVPLLGASMLGPPGWAAAGAMAVGSGVGEASERARAAGATEAERNAALPQGALVGASELIPVSFLRFLGPAGNGIMTRIARITAEGGVEAGQEAAAEALQNAIEMGYNPERELGDNILPSAGVGFSTGAIVQALVDFAIRDRGPRVEPVTPDEEPLALPAPPDQPDLPLQGGRGAAPVTEVTAEEAGVTEQDLADIGVQLDLPLDTQPAEVIPVEEQPVAIVEAVETILEAEAEAGRTATVEDVAPRFAGNIADILGRDVSPQEIIDTYNAFTADTETTAEPTAPVQQAPAQTEEVQADTQEAPQQSTEAATAETVSEELTPAQEAERAADKLWGFDREEGAVDAGPNIAEDTRAIAEDVEEIADAARDADPDAGVITTAVLDSLGIPKGSAVYNAARSGASQETVRKKLGTFATRTKDANVARRVQEFLAPTDQGGGGAGPAGDTRSAVQPRRVSGSPTGAGAPEREGLAVSGLGVRSGPTGAGGGADTLAQRAAPGATTGTAGQVIPEGTPPTPYTPPAQTRFNPETQRVERVRERTATEQRIDAATQARQAEARKRFDQEFAQWRVENVPAGVRQISRDVADGIGEIADVTTASDKQKILSALRKRRAWDFTKPIRPTKNVSKEEFAAARYFLRDANPMHTLELIAHDAVYGAEVSDPEAEFKDMMRRGKAGDAAAKRLMRQEYKAAKATLRESPEYQYHRMTGRKYASQAVEWVRGNLSQEARGYLDEQIAQHRRDLSREASRYTQLANPNNDVDSRRTLSQGEVARRELRNSVAEAASRYDLESRVGRAGVSIAAPPEGLNIKLLQLNPMAEFSQNVHPAVYGSLRAGDLNSALISLAFTTNSPYVRELASALAPFTGDTRVYVETEGDPFYDAMLAPKEAAGAYVLMTKEERDDTGDIKDWFDYYNDSIILNDSQPTVHALLHEAVHMATAKVLNNRTHPTTKALQRLYDQIAPQIEGEYGAKNLSEFLAEGLSNPRFRSVLAQFNPSGEKANGLERFIRNIANFVRSLLGRTPKTPGTVLDKLDQMVYETLAPSPGLADKFFMEMLTPEGSINALKGVVNNARPFDVNHGRQVASTLIADTVPDWAKSFTLGLVPLRNLVDMAKGVFGPQMEQLIQLANGMSAELRGLHERLDNTLQHTSEWVQKNRNQLDALNTLSFTATLNDVDPGKPRSTYKNEPEKLDTWDKLQPLWRDLKRTGGDKEFNRMRGMFENLRKEAQVALKERIGAMTGDKAKRDSIYKELEGKIFSQNLMDVYVPLQRSGKYWLTYTAIDPVNGNREVFKHSFSTLGDRQKAKNQLKELADRFGIEGIEEYTNIKELYRRETPPTPFVRDLMNVLNTSGVDQATQTDVMDLVLDLIPERSFLNSFRAREGVRGFEGDITPLSLGKQGKHDMVRFMHQRASSMARQITRMKYSARAGKFRADLNEAFKKNPGTTPAQVSYANQMWEELDKRAANITGMNRSEMSRRATGGLFFMTLGFNMSSAAVNMFALPTIVYGTIGPKYGFANVARAFGSAHKLIAASGRERNMEEIGPDGNIIEKRGQGGRFDYSFSNYDFDAAGNEKIAHLKYLADEARESNQLHRSLVFDMAEIDETTSTAGMGTQWEKVRAMSGSIFHHSERYARETTLLTTYQLELEKMANGRDITRLSPEQYQEAARNAVYIAELTNGSVAATAAPRLAQTDIGAVLMLYKRYMLSMIGLQATMINRAFRGATKEERRLAQLQFASTYGLLATFAGVSGVPIYGMISDLWNLFIADDDEEDFDTAVRTALGELGYSGVLNYVTGREVASRIGLNDMLFRESVVDQPLMMDLMLGFGGPAVGILNNSFRGIGQLQDGEIYRGMETLLPAFARSILRAGRYGATGEAQTMRGDAIVDDIGVADVIGQAIGFAPAKYVYQLEMNSQYKRMDRAIADTRSRLMKQLYMAQRERNYAEAREIRKEIAEFNQKHPQYMIKPSNIKRSLDQHEETTRTMVGGVTYNPANRDMIQRMQREWSAPTFWGG